MQHVRRERFREETKVEAKRIALEQPAEQGLAGISVNAIAKRMGVTGPAVYRYFKGREDLLDDLVRDAWHDLANTVEESVAAASGGERFRAFADAFRAWGVTQPHRYLLLFGTPLPGYRAPPDTIMAAHRTMSALLGVLPHEGEATARVVHSGRPARGPGGLARRGGSAPPAVLLTGLRAFSRLHGVLSLEVTGQFGPMGIDPAPLYRAEVESLILGDSGVRGSTRLSGPG
ncbi:hypothetical protein A6A25_00970 [Saccharothrix sp. CB00851]|nr:hypothetical protein A6A25_00970 [Saccharothrix sp. CB00851]